MKSSGQFEAGFVAEMECADCGLIDEVDVSYDPELIQPWVFTCSYGHENRPDLADDDPDKGRDD